MATSSPRYGIIRWITLLLYLSGVGMCKAHLLQNKAVSETTGGKKSIYDFSKLVRKTTSLTIAGRLADYGCWCGPGGHGKVVDDVDLCCKIHDFCYGRLERALSCKSLYSKSYSITDHYTCENIQSYGDDPDAKCKFNLCICDWDAAHCFGRMQSHFSSQNVNYNGQNSCNNTGDAYTETTADIAIMIQPSKTIATDTLSTIKSITEKLVTHLDSRPINCKFAVGLYATTIKMSQFRDAKTTVNALKDYKFEGSETIHTNEVLQEMENTLTHHQASQGLRGGNTPKVAVMFLDCVTKTGPINVLRMHSLAKHANRLKDNDIRIVGVLVKSNQCDPKLDELQSIVSDKYDAIDAVGSDVTADKVAKNLAFRVQRWVHPVSYKVLVETLGSTFSLFGEGTDDYVFIQVFGTNGQTGVHILYKPQRRVDVFERGNTDDFHFSDGNVGTITKIGIKRRLSGFGIVNDDWKLGTIKVTMNGQTRLFRFNGWIDRDLWYFKQPHQRKAVAVKKKKKNEKM